MATEETTTSATAKPASEPTAEATKPDAAAKATPPTIEDQIAAVTAKAAATEATVATHETAIAAVTAKAAATEATVATHAAVIATLTAPPAPKAKGGPYKKLSEAATVAELSALLVELLARFGISDAEPVD